jgi:hypothetical protein
MAAIRAARLSPTPPGVSAIGADVSYKDFDMWRIA